MQRLQNAGASSAAAPEAQGVGAAVSVPGQRLAEDNLAVKTFGRNCSGGPEECWGCEDEYCDARAACYRRKIRRRKRGLLWRD